MILNSSLPLSLEGHSTVCLSFSRVLFPQGYYLSNCLNLIIAGCRDLKTAEEFEGVAQVSVYIFELPLFLLHSLLLSPLLLQ